MSCPKLNSPNSGDGLTLLATIPDESIKLTFFDPEYQMMGDKQRYDYKGAKQNGRALLPSMSTETINDFASEIARILKPSGHLCLWIDKPWLFSGIGAVIDMPASMQPVDLITWDKQRIGMGYRSRHRCEYLVIFQKKPLRAKGVWTSHSIPDVWVESVPRKGNHVHAKPEGLQSALIEALTDKGDIVVDPAAGGYSVMRAAHAVDRQFLGTDLLSAELPTNNVFSTTDQADPSNHTGKS